MSRRVWSDGYVAEMAERHKVELDDLRAKLAAAEAESACWRRGYEERTERVAASEALVRELEQRVESLRAYRFAMEGIPDPAKVPKGEGR